VIVLQFPLSGPVMARFRGSLLNACCHFLKANFSNPVVFFIGSNRTVINASIKKIVI
jgi:hypothetical protein